MKKKKIIILFFLISILVFTLIRERKIEVSFASEFEKSFPIELILNNKVVFKGSISNGQILNEIAKEKTSKVQNVIQIVDLNSNKRYNYNFLCFWDKYIFIMFYKNQSNDSKVTSFDDSYFKSYPW